LRIQIGDRSVFFLLSGGVDSTVAFTLLSEVLPPDRLYGLFIDTGFMRSNEGNAVRDALSGHGIKLNIEDASHLFFERLSGIVDPEQKRRIIGDLFLEVQARCVERLDLDPERWILGQGTIYPDTIESGGTKKSHLIKTHHNRVPAIQGLIDAGRIVEPIKDLYKDEVRDLGRLLSLPDDLVKRHPFPGPGLAIRCLCAADDDWNISAIENHLSNQPILEMIRTHSLTCHVMPIRSVGVQGDQRTYAKPAVLRGAWPEWEILLELARMPNATRAVNRVLFHVAGVFPDGVRKSELTRERLSKLREADDIVSKFLLEKEIYDEIWQFPVVIVPLGRRDVIEEAIILRPVISADAMTVSPYPMRREQTADLAARLIAIGGIGSVFFDLTTKPPGTIEWE